MYLQVTYINKKMFLKLEKQIMLLAINIITLFVLI